MWFLVSLGVTSCSFLFLLYFVRQLSDWPARCLLLIIWLRYALAAFPEITYPPIALGFSIIALFSISSVLVGLLLIEKSMLRLKYLVPLYLVLFLIAVSGVINQQFIGLINVFTKWGYFIVVALLVYHSMRRHGEAKVFIALLSVYFLPMTLQLISVLIGYEKSVDLSLALSYESDRRVHYIGGYNHQAAFSTIVLSFLVLISLVDRRAIRFQIPLAALAAFGLLMANYRTALLGAVPVLAAFLLGRSLGSFVPSQRSLIAIAAVPVLAIALFFAGDALRADFVDFRAALEEGPRLFRAPAAYTEEQKDIFTGRAYIWSQYIDGYLRGDAVSHVVGYGPESWRDRMTHYAHNTFVSYLYEYGVLGLGALVLMWTGVIWSATKAPDGLTRASLVTAHLGFLILNLATMPLWLIEGMILFAILCGYTWYLAGNAQRARAGLARAHR